MCYILSLYPKLFAMISWLAGVIVYIHSGIDHVFKRLILLNRLQTLR